MRAIFSRRAEVQKVSAAIAQTFDDLVSAITSRPLEIGNVRVFSGTGTPENAQTANIGDIFLRTDSSAGVVHYQKISGTNTKTGWSPIGCASGVWTPADASGAGLAFVADQPCRYVSQPLTSGRLVTAVGALQYPATASGAAAKIGGLPFPCGTTAGSGSIGVTTAGLAFTLYVRESASQVEMLTTASANITNVQMTGAFLRFTVTYFSPS